jgi:hypothetical protein
MSYDDRFGSTNIKSTTRDNLGISRDELDGEVVPVLLYTPDMRDSNTHHHIPLTRREAADLHGWLGRYLADRNRAKS